MKLAEQQQLDRLRREAHEGVCPVCGRKRLRDMERAVRSYAEANSRLHARVMELEQQVAADR